MADLVKLNAKSLNKADNDVVDEITVYIDDTIDFVKENNVKLKGLDRKLNELRTHGNERIELVEKVKDKIYDLQTKGIL